MYTDIFLVTGSQNTMLLVGAAWPKFSIMYGRQIPGQHQLHGLQVMTPGESRIICMIYRRIPDL